MAIERLELTARYSKIVVRDATVYLAGIVAEDPDGDMEAQARSVFAQIDDLLAKAGSNKSKLLALTVWLKDFAHYGAYNETYDRWIDRRNLPARATVRADLFDPRLLIEIMATAAK